LRLKKDCAWRTALVVEELADEIEKTKQGAAFMKQINVLMEKKFPLEIEYNNLISKKIEEDTESYNDKIDALMKEINAIDAEISPLIKKQQAIFNPYWGEVMRVGIEESYFANQVERYACIYMAKLSDLLRVSPRTYFRSFKRAMPHEA